MFGFLCPRQLLGYIAQTNYFKLFVCNSELQAFAILGPSCPLEDTEEVIGKALDLKVRLALHCCKFSNALFDSEPQRKITQEEVLIEQYLTTLLKPF